MKYNWILSVIDDCLSLIDLIKALEKKCNIVKNKINFSSYMYSIIICLYIYCV